ncbi:hypothetical protein D3C72_1944990 [compost metagenome]
MPVPTCTKVLVFTVILFPDIIHSFMFHPQVHIVPSVFIARELERIPETLAHVESVPTWVGVLRPL